MSTSVAGVKGKELVSLALTRLGEEYILGALAPKNNAGWHGPWDCAEFVSWLIFQTTGRLYGCQNNHSNPAVADAYTGYFNRDAGTIGIKIPVSKAAATPGAFLLRVAVPDLPGHIVVSDGSGGTVEAHSRADGVIRGKINNRRWDTGILVPWIHYSETKPVVVVKPRKKIFRITIPPMKSVVVGEIQKALNNRGFDTKGIDRIYGRNTAKAVTAFQEAMGLVVDGEVGPETGRELGVKW
jgi:hypothetical protein